MVSIHPIIGHYPAALSIIFFSLISLCRILALAIWKVSWNFSFDFIPLVFCLFVVKLCLTGVDSVSLKMKQSVAFQRSWTDPGPEQSPEFLFEHFLRNCTMYSVIALRCLNNRMNRVTEEERNFLVKVVTITMIGIFMERPVAGEVGYMQRFPIRSSGECPIDLATLPWYQAKNSLEQQGSSYGVVVLDLFHDVYLYTGVKPHWNSS